MNYLVTSANGKVQSTYDKVEDARNAIYYSLSIRKGRWHADLNFGLDIEEALLWMIDADVALNYTVELERDSNDKNRVNIQVTVTNISGTPMIFSLFVCVGGTSPSFTFP